jgi:ubiquinone/menaquinone biosynthesis C-methylase UbiE
MPKGEAELAMIREFEAAYRRVTAPVMQEIERGVCGCDYGGTSWTTRDHAEMMARLLSLRPGKMLLEVGAGAGWPALYIAKLTECRVVLTDLPIDGLRIAHDRAKRDGLADRYTVIQADGAALPVKDAAFDAVSHSDVLCCLEDKVGVLRECRRAIRKDGRMAFTVIYVPSGLSAADYAEAVSAGPAFVEAEATYEAMLAQTGWQITSHVDLTSEFAQSMHRMAQTQEVNAAALVELSGADAARDRLARVREQLPAIERRLLLRGLFVAKPV